MTDPRRLAGGPGARGRTPAARREARAPCAVARDRSGGRCGPIDAAHGIGLPLSMARVRAFTGAQRLDNIIQNSDNLRQLKDGFLQLLAKKPLYVLKLLRKDHEEFKESLAASIMNEGVVSALVLSFTVGLAVEPLEPNDAADEFAGYREMFATVYFVLMHVASVLAGLGVLLALLWINWCSVYVADCDDFVHFILTFPHSRVWIPTAMSTCLTFVGLVHGSLALADASTAKLILCISLAIMFVFVVFVVSTFVAIKRRADTAFEEKNRSVKDFLVTRIDEAIKQRSQTSERGDAGQPLLRNST